MNRTYWPNKEWQTTNPAELKLDAEKLSNLDSVIRKEYNNIAGILIVRNGYIAYENYYDGYCKEDTIHVASVTKSILSALIGIAIDKGFIKSVDEKILDFFPEYIVEPKDLKKQEITIKHLLTMTAPYSYKNEPFKELCYSPDWAKYALDLLGGEGNIGDFKYSTAGAHLLSTIITRSTGKSAREFANEYLFRPIGMRELPNYEMNVDNYLDFIEGKHVTGWIIDPTGNSTGGWGLTLTPRDMARFGFLYLNHGLWNKKKIVSSKWIEDSIQINDNHYGYLWWVFEEDYMSAYCALGDGGNVICCIPEKEMVISIASKFTAEPKDRMALIKDFILSAVID